MPVVVTLEVGDTARTLTQPHGSKDMLMCPQLQSRQAQSRPRSTSVIYTGDRNSSNGNFIVFFPPDHKSTHRYCRKYEFNIIIMMKGFPGGASSKEPTCQCRRHETRVQPLCWEDPLQEEMATHSSIHAWRIPWTEKPGGLQSRASQRVRDD